MTNFCLIGHFDPSVIIAEIEENQGLYGKRERSLPIHRDTTSIILRERNLGWTAVIDYDAEFMPVTMGVAQAFADSHQRQLQALLIVSLKPNGRVGVHPDVGPYYDSTDRFHFVLDGESMFYCGDAEQLMKTGEIWWFRNNLMHSAFNPSASPRIHMILDLLKR